MKRISLAGLILGTILGALAAMLSGSWIFWLGVGLAVGMMLGAAQARKRVSDGNSNERLRSGATL